MELESRRFYLSGLEARIVERKTWDRNIWLWLMDHQIYLPSFRFSLIFCFCPMDKPEAQNWWILVGTQPKSALVVDWLSFSTSLWNQRRKSIEALDQSWSTAVFAMIFLILCWKSACCTGHLLVSPLDVQCWFHWGTHRSHWLDR